MYNLETIIGNNSLLLWKRNSNKSNIFPNGNPELDNIVKSHALKLWERSLNELPSKVPNARLSKWQDFCYDEASSLCKDVKSYCVSTQDTCPDEESLIKVRNKFIGNQFEIFINNYFLLGLGSKYIDLGSYTPVDPTNEFGADAYATLDGMPIGIQMKNHRNPLDSDVMSEAGMEYLREISSLEYFQNMTINELKSIGYQQYIISITPFKDTRVVDTEDERWGYLNRYVKFIGPKELTNTLCKDNLLLKRFFQNAIDNILSM